MARGTGYIAKTAIQHDGALYAPGAKLPQLTPREEEQHLRAGNLARSRDEVIDPDTNQLRPGIVGNSHVDHRQGFWAIEPISGEVLVGGEPVPTYQADTTERLPDPSKRNRVASASEQITALGESKPKCQGRKANGEPCSITAGPNGYCSYHQDQAEGAPPAGGEPPTGDPDQTGGTGEGVAHGPAGGEQKLGG